MGSGIIGTQLMVSCSKAKIPVTMILRKKTSLAKGVDIESEFITFWHTSDWLDLAKCSELSSADIIIEATQENFESKSQVLQLSSLVMSEVAILATTTSSLTIDSLSKSLSSPEKLIGLHFFNPVIRNPLVEVCAPNELSSSSVGLLNQFLEALGKKPFYVPDNPGFVVNSILFSMFEGAIKILNSTELEVSEIDFAMKSVCKHPMGPFELMDFIGLDTTLCILENLNDSRLTQNPVHDLLRKMIENGKLGKKSSSGFYDYGN